MQERIKDEMNKVFNPEFLNRLDDIMVFHPLSREHISQIVSILLKDVQRRVGDEVRLTQAAIDFLVKGYDESYGARPLKRAIERYIEDPLSERILVGEFGRGDEIEVDVAPKRPPRLQAPDRHPGINSPRRRSPPAGGAASFSQGQCGFVSFLSPSCRCILGGPAVARAQEQAPPAPPVDSIIVVGSQRLSAQQS